MVDFKMIQNIEDYSRIMMNIILIVIYIGAILFLCETLSPEAEVKEILYFITILLLIVMNLFLPSLKFITNYIFYVVEEYQELNERNKK